MRIALRAGESTVRVTRSAAVDPKAKNKAQLECQRSLWKPDDVIVTDFNGANGTIVVRDWGLTAGVCRHRDTKAPVSFIQPDPDLLAVSVTRGKEPVVQEWSRVP